MTVQDRTSLRSAYLYHWRRVQAERAPVRRPADEAAGT